MSSGLAIVYPQLAHTNTRLFITKLRSSNNAPSSHDCQVSELHRGQEMFFISSFLHIGT